MRVLILKKIVQFLLFITKWFRSIYLHFQSKSLLTKNDLKILSKNSFLKNIHKGNRAFVIANGPSLKKMNIDVLDKEITFTVNSFFKYENIDKWQPKYNLILDPNLFSQAVVRDSDFYQKFSELMPKTKLIAPLYRGYQSLSKNSYLNHKNLFYTAMGGSKSFGLDYEKIIPTFHGVGAYALSAAIYTGCNPIYLIGFDHDYLANRGYMDHFFDGPSVETTNRKFEKKFNKVKLSDRVPYDEELITNYRLWQDYRYLLRIAKSKNIKIFNATEGGFLDVFKRFDFKNIFE